jgi:phosphohistidine phosphatase
MILHFLRHGPAVASGTPGVEESERPLTAEGRKKTLRAAAGIRALGTGIDGVYASPLPRALQTAEIAARALGLPAPEPLDALRPDTTPRMILEAIRKIEAEAPLLVGHEPSLSGAVARLVGAGEAAVELKKAALAVVQLRRMSPQPRGTLLQLLAPATLRRLGR